LNVRPVIDDDCDTSGTLKGIFDKSFNWKIDSDTCLAETTFGCILVNG
jgi:hypothetical protein